jgi:16S rRNA (cytosine967-C5)-methyltransferase
MKPDPRVVAHDLLQAVLEQKLAFDQILESHAGLRQLEGRDRAFARLLVATVLRHLGTLDHAIDSGLKKPDIPLIAREALLLGLAQLRYLETPPHAAISTTVGLLDRRAPGLKGLVNALLRRWETLAFDESPASNLPEWLWRRWQVTYGAETAAAIAVGILQEPPLDLSVKADAAGWAERLPAQTLPLGTLRRAIDGPVHELPGYDEGAWWVQDLAASLPVKLLGDVRGKIVYDLCAAPGGKTMQLAAAGANVTAVDRSGGRLKRLRENLVRTQLSATIVEADAAQWQPPEPAEAIIIDAPCSATGTVRRHPDIPWLKGDRDVATLAALQTRLLDQAATMLKPGGIAIYCTCSLEPEEGERQLDRFAAGNQALIPDPILPEELPGLEMLLNAQGQVRALPSHLPELGGIDGFFIARLRRRALV